MSDMIAAVLKKTPTTAERHFPNPDTAEDGTRCAFIDRIEPSVGLDKGILFRFCSYKKGHLPLGLNPDFTKASAEVAASRLVDRKKGNKREPASVLWAVALGQILVIESVRGPGGPGALARYLTEMVRVLLDSSYPTIHLLDVESAETKSMIKLGGGIRAMILDTVSTHKNLNHRFGKLMGQVRQDVGGTDLVRLMVKSSSDGELNSDDVLKAYEDLDADEVDRLKLVLRNGTQLVGIDEIRLKKIVKIPADSAGLIDEGSLAVELSQFLVDLQTKNAGTSVITPDGRLV